MFDNFGNRNKKGNPKLLNLKYDKFGNFQAGAVMYQLGFGRLETVILFNDYHVLTHVEHGDLWPMGSVPWIEDSTFQRAGWDYGSKF